MSSLTTTDRLKDLLPQLFNTQKLEGNYYLRFQLTTEISALIDLKYVQESLTINGEQITAIPNLPEYVVGLMSVRNQVFLAIDLAHLVGFTPATVNLRQYQTIVVQIKSGTNSVQSEDINLFGFTVMRILGISRILSEQFSPVTAEVPEILHPFVQKFVVQQDDLESSSGNLVNMSKATNHSFLIDISQLISTQISG
ncbi:MAG: chemotaxis protein CheW [Waterburya sp.]